MKIGIICNHIFGLPAISYLLQQQAVCGLAVHERGNEAIEQIKLLAGKFKIPVSEVNKKNYVRLLKEWITKTTPDIVFVYSFSYKIPQEIINLPPLGIINFHPGCLPHYRGPDPVFWQIKHGLTETAVTAHMMNKEYDEGPVISIVKESIADDDTYGIVVVKAGYTALRCTGNVLRIITEFDLNSVKEEQKGEEASYYKKPVGTDFIIDWSKQSASEIKNLVRACNPRYQGAITFFRSFPVHILEVSVKEDAAAVDKPGVIVSKDDEPTIKISTVDKKILSLDILYSQEGCFSGEVFKRIFMVKAGERLG